MIIVNLLKKVRVPQHRPSHEVILKGDPEAWNGLYIFSRRSRNGQVNFFLPQRMGTVQWGSKRTNKIGDAVLENLARLNVVLGNVGSSIVDIMFCSPVLAWNLNWWVCKVFTLSNHMVVRYSIHKINDLIVLPVTSIWGWLIEPEFVAELSKPCDITMPSRKPPCHVRRPVYC